MAKVSGCAPKPVPRITVRDVHAETMRLKRSVSELSRFIKNHLHSDVVQLLHQGKRIMGKQEDLSARFDALQSTVDEIASESQTSLNLIQELKDAQAAGGGLDEANEGKLAALEASVKRVADLVPNQPAADPSTDPAADGDQPA